MKYTNEHIGQRVKYTGRNGNVRYGTIKGIAASFVDLRLDGSSREHFYVPEDTIELVQDSAPNP